jgi:hypothetical protein
MGLSNMNEYYNVVKYKEFGFFSYTEARIDNKILTFSFMGHVFTTRTLGQAEF